jgi:protein phosphatase
MPEDRPDDASQQPAQTEQQQPEQPATQANETLPLPPPPTAPQPGVDEQAQAQAAQEGQTAQAAQVATAETGEPAPAPQPSPPTPTEVPITEALGDQSTNGQRSTVPLLAGDGPPVPPLPEKSMLGDRYRVDTLLGVLNSTNLYRTTDMQGYRVCWACGSSASMEGDTYCVECGAQLTGRFYRLQEFNAEVEDDTVNNEHVVTLPLPEPILRNEVAGVAHVFDMLADPGKGRVYVVWEEVYGRTLSSWIEGDMGMLSSPTSGHLMELDNPEDQQILGWMAQAADILAELHSAGIGGCTLTADNLAVQPGDRLMLVDLSTCLDVAAPDAAGQLSDVRDLALELERWYIAVRDSTALEKQTNGVEGAAATEEDAETTQPQKMVSAAEDPTGPLGSPATPVVVLARAKEGAYPTAQEFAEALYEVYEESKPISNIQLWTGRASDLGRVRQINEDSLLTLEAIIHEHEGGLSTGLYVIADGMGGHQSGEVASSIAVRTIGSIVNGVLLGPLSSGDPVGIDIETCARALQQAVMEANRRISDLAKERHSDLGTTVTVAIIIGNQLCVANVGDSRTYMWREGQLAAITHDHSLVAQLVAAGQIAPEDIYTHPRRNEIYRALGDARLTNDEVDVFTRRLQPGDMVLLCSDGLWDFVRDHDINNILTKGREKDPQAVCQTLIDRANKAGGEDNISAILIRVLAPQ